MTKIVVGAVTLALAWAILAPFTHAGPRYFSTTKIVKTKKWGTDVACPAGWSVVGGGAETADRFSSTGVPYSWVEVITASYPTARGWHAEAYRSGGSSEGTVLPIAVYAVCAR